jgi:hypothetical protein
VNRWEELCDCGTPMTIEELCAACPDLVGEVRRRIEALRAMDSALDTDVHESPTVRGRDRRGDGTFRGLPEVLRASAV